MGSLLEKYIMEINGLLIKMESNTKSNFQAFLKMKLLLKNKETISMEGSKMDYSIYKIVGISLIKIFKPNLEIGSIMIKIKSLIALSQISMSKIKEEI